MFLQGMVWSQLKKMLVREGRSSRQTFIWSGAVPFFLAMFGMLCAPAFPAVGELGLVLLICALFTSRAILAQAIRRSHDLGVTDEFLASFKHQTQAYLQVFVVLMIATTFQTINTGSPATALIVAAIGAVAMACVMVGGTKEMWTLATVVGDLGPNEHGLPTEGPLVPVARVMREQLTRPSPLSSGPQPSRPKPSEPRPLPVPPREPRKAVAVPHGRPAPMSEPVSAPRQPPRIRKRSGAIGEWKQ